MTHSTTIRQPAIFHRSPPWLTVIGFALMLIPLSAGCGTAEQERVKVAGQVLLDEQPLESGVIRLVPETGRPVGGKIGPDGRFELSSQTAGMDAANGVPPGKYGVEVSTAQIVDDETSVSLTPAKYVDHHTSGIEIVVENPIDSLTIKLISEQPVDSDLPVDAIGDEVEVSAAIVSDQDEPKQE